MNIDEDIKFHIRFNDDIEPYTRLYIANVFKNYEGTVLANLHSHGAALVPKRGDGALTPRSMGATPQFNYASAEVMFAVVRFLSVQDRINEQDIDDGQSTTGGGDSSNIFVAVRVRPESEKEISDAKHRTVIRVLDDNVLLLDPLATNNTRLNNSSANNKRTQEQRFIFDRVFDPFATQQEVYESTTKDVIGYVMSGYNATVFAYGATGAGKTHTMIGNDASGAGVMVLTMRDLFQAVDDQKDGKGYTISMSYMEIYNETIRDLFAPDGSTRALDLREDASRSVIVADLSERHPTSAVEVFRLLDYANANRKQSPTELNAASSRSHAILQIFIRANEGGQPSKGGPRSLAQKCVNFGKLSLIDLAGSERANRTLNRGQRLVEGANINKSLLSLGNCINALCDGKTYVPYRDSKLTRILKDSLGGNCKTIMIANVSPNSSSYDETFNTLQYANRAKDIKTKVSKNVLNANTHVGQTSEIIKALNEEVRLLKQRLAESSNVAFVDDTSSNDDLEEYDRMSFEITANCNDTSSLKKQIWAIDEELDRIEEGNEPHDMPVAKRKKGLQLDKKILQDSLEKNEIWRRKFQLELSSSSHRSDWCQKALSNQARLACVELDRMEQDEKLVKQKKEIKRLLVHSDRLEGQMGDKRDILAKMFESMEDMYKILNENGLSNYDLARSYMAFNKVYETNSTEIANSRQKKKANFGMAGISLSTNNEVRTIDDIDDRLNTSSTSILKKKVVQQQDTTDVTMTLMMADREKQLPPPAPVQKKRPLFATEEPTVVSMNHQPIHAPIHAPDSTTAVMPKSKRLNNNVVGITLSDAKTLRVRPIQPLSKLRVKRDESTDKENNAKDSNLSTSVAPIVRKTTTISSTTADRLAQLRATKAQ
eukprot:gene11374-13259_t